MLSEESDSCRAVVSLAFSLGRPAMEGQGLWTEESPAECEDGGMGRRIGLKSPLEHSAAACTKTQHNENACVYAASCIPFRARFRIPARWIAEATNTTVAPANRPKQPRSPAPFA